MIFGVPFGVICFGDLIGFFLAESLTMQPARISSNRLFKVFAKTSCRDIDGVMWDRLHLRERGIRLRDESLLRRAERFPRPRLKGILERRDLGVGMVKAIDLNDLDTKDMPPRLTREPI